MKLFKYKKVTESAQLAQKESSANPGSCYIAGGTNIIDLMKESVLSPDCLVDIAELQLAQIDKLPSGGILIGAAARNSAVAAHELIRQNYPVLSRALLSGASPQLRNMATVGGNLLQRTRCMYFYDTKSACNKREPGAGCDAIGGFNRMNAVLGGSKNCIAVHPSDMCVALTCLDAKLHLSGLSGTRIIPIREFYKLPDDTPHVENVLKDHEIITGVELPPVGFRSNWCYLKIRDRASYAFALVAVAAALEIKNGKISIARLTLGGVAPLPWTADEAEKSLLGAAPTEDNFKRVAELTMKNARGNGYNDFKIELSKRAIVRALKIAAAGATT